MAQNINRKQEIALKKLLTQYDDLDMWIHNYLPLETTTEDEKQHLREVMMRDRALKKMDGDRIAKLTPTFPVKLRPELLSPVLNDMLQSNPAVPGSGLVSLCGPFALPKEPNNRLPASTPQFYRSQSLILQSSYPASAAPIMTSGETSAPMTTSSMGVSENRSSSLDFPTTPWSATFQKWFERGPQERCPFCFRKFNFFNKKVQCEQCQHNVCTSCVHTFVTNGEVHLCKDCLDIIRVLCKTGDWFAQYLLLKPANPLRLELDTGIGPNNNSAQRESRSLEDPIFRHDTVPVLAQPPPTARSRMTDAQKEEHFAKSRQNPTATMNDQRPKSMNRIRDSALRTAENEQGNQLSAERAKRYTFQKSMTLPLQNTDENMETTATRRSRLTRHVTVQDTEEVFNEKPELEDKSHKSRRKKLKIHSISSIRLNSFSSTNEVEASYQNGVEISGDLEVSLDYDTVNSRLAIMVLSARNIAAADKKSGTSNPYAKVYLFPDPTNKTKRKIHCKGHTCSPTFNQGVCYSLSPSDMQEKTLVIELWHKKKARGSKVFLGEITIPLRSHKWDDKERKRLILTQKHTPVTPVYETAYRGELQIGLKFGMSQNHRLISQMNAGATNFPGTLEVAVRQAKNLTSTSVGPNVSAFVKADFRTDRHKYDSQQSDVVPKSSNPGWNTVFRFADLNQQDLYKAVLELSVWHRSGLGKTPQLLGGVRLNCQPKLEPKMQSSTFNGSSMAENRFWCDLINRPDTWIEQILPIRDISY